MPFPEVWKGFFFVCLVRPIFLKTFCQSQNWSILHSELMASSILELAVGWTSSVGCTQTVVNLYTSCQGRSTKASTEFKTLLAESHDTLGLYPETVNEVNDWVRIPFGKRWSDNGGQTIEQSRRAMYFWGLRGGSTGSLLCNAIRRLRRRKRKTNSRICPK